MKKTNQNQPSNGKETLQFFLLTLHHPSEFLRANYTLEDKRLEPTAITHKGKWSEPNLHVFQPLIRGVHKEWHLHLL